MEKTDFCTRGNLNYINCDPNNREYWTMTAADPVRSNILNGCWICNIEPQQKTNNKLCDRYLTNFNSCASKYPEVVNLMYKKKVYR